MQQEPHWLMWYVPAAVLGAAVLAKLPALRRGWRNPMVRAVNAMLLLLCVTFAFCALPTVRLVNRLTGIGNLSAVLTQCILSAYACASVVLVEYWRADSAADAGVRRRVKAWILGYSLVIVSIVVLFALGDAPVDRPGDFALHYATTPFVREMSVICLLGFIVAAFATMVMCWNWAVAIGRTAGSSRTAAVVTWLRVGLLTLVFGSLAHFAFGVSRLAGIVARWTGRDWEVLDGSMTPLMAFCGSVVGVGFLMPVFGPRLTERVWHPYAKVFALRWLWRAARSPAGGGRFRPLVGTPWYLGPENMLMHRMTAIHDWMLGLYAYCRDEVRELAYLDARQRGAEDREAAAIGIAAMLKAASEDRARKCAATEEQRVRAARAVSAAEASHSDLLVRVSRVYDRAGAPRVG